MNDVKGLPRPSFFPNSPSAQKARESRRMERVLEMRTNSKQRAKEIDEATEGHTKVKIPAKVKDFSKIKAAVDMSEPIDNSNKIDDLKSQIKAGTYKIDFDQVADKMLSSEF